MNFIGAYAFERWFWISKSFTTRRSNFMGAKLRVLVEEYPPYLTIQPTEGALAPEDTHLKNLGMLSYKPLDDIERINEILFTAVEIPKSSIGGTYAPLLHSLSVNMNFTYALYRPDGEGKIGGWGRFENGSYNGMIGLMSKGLFDLDATLFTIKSARLYTFLIRLSIACY